MLPLKGRNEEKKQRGKKEKSKLLFDEEFIANHTGKCGKEKLKTKISLYLWSVNTNNTRN